MLGPHREARVIAHAGIALLAILLLATWLRLDGIAFGLDLTDVDNALLTSDVDVRGMVGEELQLLEHGDLDAGDFLFRGPATFVLFGLADGAAVALQAPFHADGWGGVIRELRANPSLLHLVHRCVSALGGVLTVALMFRVVRREASTGAALASALILATAYLHVRDSHFGTVDVLAGLATLAALDQMLLLIREPGRARHVASGLAAGVAAATKYFGVVLGVHVVLAHVFARRGARESGASAPKTAWLALALLACPLGFFLIAPTVLLTFQNWLDHAFFTVDALEPERSSAAMWHTLGFHLRYTLGCGLGEPALLLALAGAVPLWRLGRAGRFLVLGSLILSTSLVATRVDSTRYGVPFLVTLAIPAGLALAELARRLPRPLAALAVLLVIAPSLARSISFGRLLRRPDTRLEMLAVLDRRGEATEDVLAIGRALDLPVPEKKRTPPFELYFRRFARNVANEPAEFLSPLPRTILLSLTTPTHEIPDWPAVEALLATRYREVLRLEIGPDPVGIFEPDGGTRALRVAYASPWRQQRPGPALALYELVEPGDAAPASQRSTSGKPDDGRSGE